MKIKFSHIVFLALFITVMSALIINCKNILKAQEMEQLTIVSTAIEESKDSSTVNTELKENSFLKTMLGGY